MVHPKTDTMARGEGGERAGKDMGQLARVLWLGNRLYDRTLGCAFVAGRSLTRSMQKQHPARLLYNSKKEGELMKGGFKKYVFPMKLGRMGTQLDPILGNKGNKEVKKGRSGGGGNK